MNKKVFFTSLVAASVAVSLCAVALSKNDGNLFGLRADPAPTYTVVLDATSMAGADGSGSVNVRTSGGAEIQFDYSGVSISDGKLVLEDGATIANPYLVSGDHNKLSGIKRIQRDVVSGKIAVDYTWGESLAADSPYYQRRNIHWPSGNPQFSFLDEDPNYVRVVADGAATLNSITLTFSCVAGSEKGDNLQLTNPDMLERFKTIVTSGTDFEGQTVELMVDVDNNDLTNKITIPMSNQTYPFKGTFDGKGHTISNLSLSGSTQVAPFGNVVGGTIKNVTFENITATSTGQRAAGAVARAQNATIENVHVTGTSSISGTTQNGGLVGIAIDSLTIKNCSNYASVTGSTGGSNGGIVGHHYSKCMTKIIGCDNFGNVVTSTSGKTAGGILGGADGSGSAEITACEVGKTTSIQVNGVEATSMKAANGVLCGSTNSIIEVYGSGRIEDEISSVAEWNAFVSSVADSPYYANKVARLTADLDFENSGTVITRFDGMIDGNGHTISNLTLSGSSQVALIGNCTNGGVRNLTLANINSTSSGQRAAAFISRCYNSCLVNVEASSGSIVGTALTGGLVSAVVVKKSVVYDSVNRATVSGGTSTGFGGLVGAVVTTNDTGGSLYLENSKNYGNVSSAAGSIGGLIGYASNYQFENLLTIKNCNNYGNVSTTSGSAVAGLGGILGYVTSIVGATSIKLIGCENRGNVTGTGEYTAGIFGGWQTKPSDAEYIVTMNIEDCVNYGSVSTTAGNGCGGIIAATNNVQNYLVLTIRNCDNHGSISGYTYVGGIAGLIRNTSTTNASIIDGCNNYGDVEAKGGNSACGIVGEARINVTNCGCYSEATLKTQTSSFIAKNRSETSIAGYITFTYTASSVTHTGNRLINADGSDYSA